MFPKKHGLLKRRRITLRILSAFLAGSFFFQEIAWAAPEINLAFSLPSLSFQVPDSIARVEDSFRAPGSSKTLILIQDAHANPSGQLNLARLLDRLMEQERKLNTIFVGAGDGPCAIVMVGARK